MLSPTWNQNLHITSFQCKAIPTSMKMNKGQIFPWGNCHHDRCILWIIVEAEKRWPLLPSCCPPRKISVLPGYLPSSPSETLLVSSSSPEMSNIPAEDFSDLLQTSRTIWEEITEVVRKRPFGKMTVRKSTNGKEPVPARQPRVCRPSSAGRFTI